jgi:hypothetical protein
VVEIDFTNDLAEGVGLRQGGRGRALIAGGLLVGILDILDAFIFFGLRSGASPVRILQSIAAGVLGRDAFQGGLGTAALGLFLHFVIAFLIVLVYYVASGWLRALVRRPIAWGLLYGVVAYAVMSFVVVPLSSAGAGVRLPAWPVLANGVLIHALGVGVPSALAARAARRS